MDLLSKVGSQHFAVLALRAICIVVRVDVGVGVVIIVSVCVLDGDAWRYLLMCHLLHHHQLHHLHHHLVLARVNLGASCLNLNDRRNNGIIAY